jgi:hypothetical protein
VKQRDNFEDISVNGRIILKYIVRDNIGEHGLD